MKPVAIAVAGAGMIGRRHIELIQRSPQCRLVAIVDPSETVVEFANSRCVPLYRSLPELLSQGVRPDGVILATPNNLHVPQALECIAAGVATLVEKPVAHTVEAALRLAEAAEAAQVKVLVGHHRRHSSIMSKACEIIRDGTLGRVVCIVGTALFYKADNEGYFDHAPWRKEPGGGPILINMIHEIDSLRSLCGDIVAVHAFTSNAVRNFAVEDTASISFRFANGALGTFMLSDAAASSRSWEHTSGEDPHFAKAHATNDDCYLVAGTFGSLGIPTMTLKRYPRESDRSWHKALETTRVPLEVVDPLERQLAHFCDVIHGHAEPLVTVQDGLQNLRVVEAISASARTSSAIPVQ